MEFTNEIFFNKPLTAEQTVIITYKGQLYREHSKDVSIVFGYGDDWSETDSAQMKETENGFEITLEIKNYNTFNFCFNNSFNIWDNNHGFNYISPILPKQENNTINENQDNEDISDKTINNEIVENLEEITDTEDSNEFSDETEVQEQDNNDINSDDVKEFETLFSSLLDSILDDENSESESIDVSNLNGFGLQAIDEINEEEIINCDEIFSELFNQITDEPAKTQEISDSNNDVQELDDLMDNLLTSISDPNTTDNYATPIQKINETDNLPAVINQEDWVDKILNFSYNFTKKITTACKKFGTLIKIKAKEFGLINNK